MTCVNDAWRFGGRRSRARLARHVRAIGLWAGVFLGALLSSALATAAVPALEYQVKAAFLLSFVTFTEWPVSAFESPSTPLRICVVGDDPFNGSLVRTVQGESVAGHALVADRIMRGEDVLGCHVVFVPRSAADRVTAIAREVPDAPVLIVSESGEPLRAGATITFTVDDGRVRFDVNRTAAERNGLRFSSRLLRSARVVR